MSNADLLTTQQAATVLGCSRQHVVDLCMSGRLPYTRIGSHRRIRRADLEAFAAARPLGREELRSLWLHRAVAGKVVLDPERAIATARRNLARMVAAEPRAATYAGAWERLLDSGPESVLATLTSDTAEAIQLRQNTPFAGLLTEAERQAVLTAFAASWERRSGGTPRDRQSGQLGLPRDRQRGTPTKTVGSRRAESSTEPSSR